MTNQRTIILAIAAFILVVGGLFGFAYYKKAQLSENVENPNTNEPADTETTRINAVHFFKDGTHTIVGELMMPTPCDLINATALVRESFPEQVTVSIETVKSGDDEICAQVVTPQRFKVSFSASDQATIDATLDGRPAILNLIEGDPNQNPDDIDIELFFKG